MNVKSDVILKNHINVNGNRYNVDGKKVVLEPSKKEINTALWLVKKLNVPVVILPKIHQPEGIKTSDYLINNENWDLKEVISCRKDAIYNRLRNKKGQASNFVIDISKSRLTIKAAIKQVSDLYQRKDFLWLNNIIIKNKNEIMYINRQ